MFNFQSNVDRQCARVMYPCQMPIGVKASNVDAGNVPKQIANVAGVNVTLFPRQCGRWVNQCCAEAMRALQEKFEDQM